MVEALKAGIASAVSLVFVNFHGLNVAATTTLRRNLKQTGVKYLVAKKTLLRRALAASASQIAGEAPALDGEVAIAFGEDMFLPAKGIYEFQSKINPPTGGGLKILGGIFEQKFRSAVEMTQIAMIPSREVLYGQLVSLFASPMRGLVITLDQISKSKN